MKLRHAFGAVAITLSCATQPAISGNAEQIERCANAIQSGPVSIVKVGRFKFRCGSLPVTVMTEAAAMQMPGSSNKHAYFTGRFIHMNPVIANDIVTYPIVIQNWADAQSCRIGEPSIKITRRSKLIKIGEFTPNTWDWKAVSKKIDGNWEAASFMIAAAAIRKWHTSNQYSHCKREW